MVFLQEKSIEGVNVSIFKPSKHFRKKELIEEALKDLDPSIREQARRILEELDESTLQDKKRIKEYLKRYRII